MCKIFMRTEAFPWTLLVMTLISAPLARAQPAECVEPHREILAEYKAFHSANRKSPDAKYIIQTCWAHSCGGAGDRMRGTLWLLRVAIAHKKILLVDWTRPAPVTDFFLPNDIDWSFSGLDPASFHVENTLSGDDFNRAVYDSDPGALDRFHTTKIIITMTRQHFQHNVAGSPPVERVYEDGSCYFKFMFKPHPAITARADEHLQILYGTTTPEYIAWHWRHGGADSPAEEPILVSELNRRMYCLEQLAHWAGLSSPLQKPALLLTDFNAFRQLVLASEFARIVTPKITARHIDLLEVKEQEDKAEELVGVFVDLYLLSRGRCLLTSAGSTTGSGDSGNEGYLSSGSQDAASGFAALAIWMRGSGDSSGSGSGGTGGVSGELLTCHREMAWCFGSRHGRH